MSEYTITNITDRLDDLNTYLYDLETALESAKEAREDLQRYATDLETLDTIADKINAHPHLHTDLLDYIAEHRHTWPHRTETMFTTLAELLATAASVADTPHPPTSPDTESITLTITPEQLIELIDAIKNLIGTPSDNLTHTIRVTTLQKLKTAHNLHLADRLGICL